MYAFPNVHDPKTGSMSHGMSLRDYFAAKAMQGGIDLVPHMATPKVDKPVPQIIAEMAYEYADAMMKARDL
jgi:hypothetical protein